MSKPSETVSVNNHPELRSDEVQEILTHVPHGIIRWGIGVIFLVVLLLLAISRIITYPDVISAQITVITEHPPIHVVARSNGKLVLYADNKTVVKTGADLAVIENPADVDAVFMLREKLDTLKAVFLKPEFPGELSLKFNEAANLGELQNDYSNFLQSYLDYRFFIEHNFHTKKIQSIEEQIAYYEDLNRELMDQKAILSREVDIARLSYDNNQVLYSRELISNIDLANSESAYLQKQYSLENAEASMINHNIQLSEYRKTIMDLQQQFYEKKRNLVLAIQESYKHLQSQLANWEHLYVLKAPIDGTVSFFKYWSDNQFVNAGDEVMTIIPNSGDITGKVYLPAMGSGKVEIGQKVQIKFDNYPFTEFGAVEGEVASISGIAHNNEYLINVNLVNGLTTNYGKTLKFKQAMQGTADIITDELSIFERIFSQLRYILSSNVSG